MHKEKHRPPSLNLMGVVCDREKREKVLKIFEGQKVFFNLMTLGKGTANSKILGYLGLGETEKVVFFAILPVEIAKITMEKLDEKMQFHKPGHGVAYTAKIHEGCYHKLVHIPQENNEGEKMEQAETHDLVIVITNRGYTEEVMDAARKAGATGGTVLHARGCGLAGAEKFFGITIQPEKELIMILAETGTSCAIMELIAEKTGPGTEPGAISFSLPVNNVMGIGLDIPKKV